jgi:hypothetical protein
VAGVTVELLDLRSKLFAKTTTSASGWYVFRFTQPGTYTVRIVVPAEYLAGETSVTLALKRFQEARVDFYLK